MLLFVYAGSYRRTVNCSWEAVYLPKLAVYVSCRALPSPQFSLASPVQKDTTRRLDVAYNSTKFYIYDYTYGNPSSKLQNGTYYVPPFSITFF